MPSPPACRAADRPSRHNTSTTSSPRSEPSPQTQAVQPPTPKTRQRKKNHGYKYQQRPWYSAQRWRECQGSIIYAAQRKSSDLTAPADGAAACLRRRLGSAQPLISRDSTRREQLNVENCFKRQNPLSLWCWCEVCQRGFRFFPSRADVKNVERRKAELPDNL